MPLGKLSYVQPTKDDLIYYATYDGSNNVIYEGYAKPGTATSDIGWQIRKSTYTSTNRTSTLFAGGDNGFLYEWDERASYNYS